MRWEPWASTYIGRGGESEGEIVDERVRERNMSKRE
jgi:hypothetical protein